MIKRDSKAEFRRQKTSANDTTLGCGCLFGLVGAGTGILIGGLSGTKGMNLICPTTGGGAIGFIVGIVAAMILAVVSSPEYYLCSGKYKSNPISAKRYHEIAQKQKDSPCLVMQTDSRAWWWFQGEIYWENENLSELEFKALILERRRKRKRRMKRAITLMEHEKTGAVRQREPIPDDVKMFVWQRDEGKCVKCNNRENLEFDHIIPLSMGGSNTARNIQLLCETCNRSKGGSLV